MRLTLRSLLAYIDNLLPQADNEEFETLLSESEAANNLCKRIRSVITRPELGAPELLDKGPHLDPNITADYLDNVLDSGEAPEYEKLCLASDRQLAEVGACHQILTVVQVEPAEVDPAWREGIYQLPERLVELEVQPDYAPIASAAESGIRLGSQSGVRLGSQSGVRLGSQSGVRLGSQSGIRLGSQSGVKLNGESSGPNLEPSASGIGQKPPVSLPKSLEDYAQMIVPEPVEQPTPAQAASGGGIKKLLAIVVGIAAVLLIGVFVFMRSGNKTDLASTSGSDTSSNSNATPGDSAVTQPATDANSGSTPAEPLSEDKTSQESATLATTPESESKATEEKSSESNDSEVKLSFAVPTEKSSGETGTPSTDSTQPSDGRTVTPPAELPEATPGSEKPDSGYASPVLDDSDETPSTDSTPDTPANGSAVVPVQPESKPLVTGDIPQARIGQYQDKPDISPQILLYRPFSNKEADWQRLQEFAGISSDSSLMALPDYRPQLKFGSDLTIHLVGPAKLNISPDSTAGALKFQLEYGRLIVWTSASFNRKLTIATAKLPTIVEIASPNVKLAIQTDQPIRTVGDPTSKTPPVFGTIMLPSGAVNVLKRGGTQASAITSPASIDLQTGTFNANGLFEEWITSEELPGADLEKRLQGDKPITVLLREYVDGRVYNRQFLNTVLTSLAMVGSYSSLFEDFNKTEKKNQWPIEFKVLQSSVFRNSDNATQIKNELTRRFGAAGLDIYEILWKYQGPLDQYAAGKLIGYLSHDKQIVRVAAYCLMKNRGLKMGTYAPDDLKKSEKSLNAISDTYHNGIE